MPRTLVAALEAASALLLAVLTVNAVFELLVWVVWKRSFASLDEVQAILMVWFGMASAAYCLARGSHLAVDVLVRRLGSRLEPAVATVPPIAVVVFGLLLAIYGWRLISALDNTLPATGWSADLQYQPVAVMGVLLTAIGLWQLRLPTPDRDDTGSEAR